MTLPTEDDIRHAVVKFIFENAEDSECLFEPIGDLYPYDTSEYNEEAERAGIELAYKLHRKARVIVEIDGWEYVA